MKNVPERAAIYARVATENKIGTALNQQIEMCKEYAQKRCGKEVAFIYSDCGSGMERKREGLEKMFMDAQQGKFDVLVIRDLSRLSRHGLHVVQMVKNLVNKLGVKIMLTEDKSTIDCHHNKKMGEKE